MSLREVEEEGRMRECKETGNNLIILLPLTGRSGGKRKRTVVTIT